MTPRVAVAGARGRLGFSVARAFPGAVALDRAALDLSRTADDLARALDAVGFDWLINCAALAGVDYCEEHPAEAGRVNGTAPGDLARLCAARGAGMLHVSTDYVFDGNGDRPLREEDAPSPVNAYGRSKLLGERLVLAASPRHLVVRVSWIFGPGRPAFVDQILDRAAREEVVEAVGDKFSCPSYAPDLAAAFARLIAAGASGVVHCCNSGPDPARAATSWLGYAREALRCAADAGLPVRAREVREIAFGALPALSATRPRYTAMDTGRYAALAGGRPRHWAEALRDHVAARAARAAHCGIDPRGPAA